MILVSACLLGINCKYNGGSNNDEAEVKEYLRDKAIYNCVSRTTRRTNNTKRFRLK